MRLAVGMACVNHDVQRFYGSIGLQRGAACKLHKSCTTFVPKLCEDYFRVRLISVAAQGYIPALRSTLSEILRCSILLYSNMPRLKLRFHHDWANWISRTPWDLPLLQLLPADEHRSLQLDHWMPASGRGLIIHLYVGSRRRFDYIWRAISRRHDSRTFI